MVHELLNYWGVPLCLLVAFKSIIAKFSLTSQPKMLVSVYMLLCNRATRWHCSPERRYKTDLHGFILRGHLVIKLQMIPLEFNLLIFRSSIKLLQSVSGERAFSLRIKKRTAVCVMDYFHCLSCRVPPVSVDLVVPAAPREPMGTQDVLESLVFLVPE